MDFTNFAIVYNCRSINLVVGTHGVGDFTESKEKKGNNYVESE
jgi:hypothetical protein